MKQFTYICDRCGRPIAKDVYRLYVGIVNPETDDSPECYELNEIGDSVYCSKCLSEVDKIIYSATFGPKEETPKKVTKPKKKIDDGKIQALRDAGWTLKAIADEIGCCEQTVLNRLNALEKK